MTTIIKKMKENWKPLLFLFVSTVVAGFLYSTGFINVRVIVVLSLCSFVAIILLVILANAVIKKNTNRINSTYKNLHTDQRS